VRCLLFSEELYDLSSDIAEIHNMARNPLRMQLVARFRHLLVQWMDKTADLLLSDFRDFGARK